MTLERGSGRLASAPAIHAVQSMARRFRAGNLGRALACAVFVVLLAVPAAAHRSAPAGPKTGLSLPSVTHGQMIVLANHLAAIRALADEQYPTDPEMRRLQAYINLQHFYCAWGLMPGSLRDESSPFNECTHGYLAGARALLLHLQRMPGDLDGKRALGRRIDVEMLDNHAAMALCRFSDEPFNTADVIIPRLGSVLTNPTCGAVLLVIGLMAFLFGAAASAGLAALFGEPRETPLPRLSPERM